MFFPVLFIFSLCFVLGYLDSRLISSNTLTDKEKDELSKYARRLDTEYLTLRQTQILSKSISERDREKLEQLYKLNAK